ncbi:MAG: hypothetical protein ABF633_06775 [Clostridium sp.]|uniref:hypothetical protein n=1 Tax=Clostridium sp. TaxID=1506 RepID=UPI0039ED0FA4
MKIKNRSYRELIYFMMVEGCRSVESQHFVINAHEALITLDDEIQQRCNKMSTSTS